MIGMISSGQLRRIWAAAREIGWGDTRVHEELVRVIGVSSLRDLTAENASLFISYLVSEGATPGRMETAEPKKIRGPRPADLIELATPAQHRYVEALLKSLGWSHEEPYFLGALKKATGKTRIRTRREATMAIIFLEKMVEQRQPTPEQSHSEPGNGSTRR